MNYLPLLLLLFLSPVYLSFSSLPPIPLLSFPLQPDLAKTVIATNLQLFALLCRPVLSLVSSLVSSLASTLVSTLVSILLSQLQLLSQLLTQAQVQFSAPSC